MNLFYPAIGVALVWYFFFNKKMSYAPPNSFTLYYMNGCGYCDKIMPVFDEYMSKCPVPCRKVEASQNSEYGVKGYPTFVFTDSNGYGHECKARTPEAWDACIRQNS